MCVCMGGVARMYGKAVHAALGGGDLPSEAGPGWIVFIVPKGNHINGACSFFGGGCKYQPELNRTQREQGVGVLLGDGRLKRNMAVRGCVYGGVLFRGLGARRKPAC